MSDATALRQRILGWIGWGGWHLGAAVLLVMLVSARFGSSFWAFSASLLDFRALHFPVAAFLVGGYLVAAVALALEPRESTRIQRVGHVVRSSAVGFGIAAVVLLMSGTQASRLVLVLGTVLGTGLLGVRRLLPNEWRGRAGLALLPVSLLVATASSGTTIAPPTRSSTTSTVTETAYHAVRVTVHEGLLPGSASRHTGGGLADGGDFQLVGTADGDLIEVRWESGGPQPRRLPITVPLDRTKLVSATSLGAFTRFYRVLDIEFTDDGGLLASYHHWRDEGSCFVVRVSLLRDFREVALGRAPADWEPLYDTAPCLEPYYARPASPFLGQEAGGRMALVGDSLYLTVGDHGYNGVDFPIDLVQDPSSDYGKVLLLRRSTGSSEGLSIGHRNPQGLVVDDGHVWITEHGPEGGDELNLFRTGANYGWPLATYGTDYGQSVWPVGDDPNRHEGFEQPLYAWVPSVGISNLVRIRGELFERWKGDLLIASLRGGQLLRVRLKDIDEIVSVEPIHVGHRIRDLLELQDGRVILLLDNYSLAVVDVTDSPFSACAGCHRGSVDDPGAIGPPLSGVVGRDIASLPEFPYSQALTNKGGRWTPEALDAFLAAPQDFAAGSSMLTPGISNPEQRTEIIRYLMQLGGS